MPRATSPQDPPPAARRDPVALGEARRRLLEATLEVIGTEGIAAVTNRRVASRAGVSLGSLTYHFPSQAQLLRESLILQVDREVARIEAITARIGQAGVTLQELVAEAEHLVAETSDDPAQLAELDLHLHAARHPELREASARCFAAYDDLAGAALRALSLPESDARAHLVVAMLNGLALRRLALRSPGASGVAEALVVLVRGLTAD
ncbi:MAG: transcriptional regulator, TetR family [Solirubrobacterales bacterium]|jgi:AcrR family transcriptional regulator|nr:transcriptional regulator, TetR family [Solirubrobacterales bacterium]